MMHTYGNASNAYKNGHLGDATKETLRWFNDPLYIVNTTYPVAQRGSWYGEKRVAGLFNFSSSTGGNDNHGSFHIVLTAQDGVD